MDRASAFMKIRNENMKESSYNSSIQKPILCTNTLEPSQTFIANSRNKACEKLSQLEGIHIPSYLFDYKMVNYTLTSGFFLTLIYIPLAIVSTSTFINTYKYTIYKHK